MANPLKTVAVELNGRKVGELRARLPVKIGGMAAAAWRRLEDTLSERAMLIPRVCRALKSRGVSGTELSPEGGAYRIWTGEHRGRFTAILRKSERAGSRSNIGPVPKGYRGLGSPR